LIYAKFIGVDGNYRLARHNKGGGEITDQSYFGDRGFYVQNELYKEYSRVRGAVDSEINVCRK